MARHAPAARRRPIFGRALAAVAALAVVATACGSQATPSPSNASSGSLPPAASASIAASPSPSADPSAAAIRAFVALVTQDGFSYQATLSGDDRHSASILKISKGLLQVHGSDVLVRATFTDRSASTVVEHRVVGGKAWLRFATFLDWDRLSLARDETMAAFAGVHAAADVVFLKTVKSDGKTLFQVRIPAAIVHPKLIPYTNLSDEDVRKGTLTLLIDDHGRPVRGTNDINATGRISGQLQEIVIELTVTFTKVGQPVSIKAP